MDSTLQTEVQNLKSLGVTKSLLSYIDALGLKKIAIVNTPFASVTSVDQTVSSVFTFGGRNVTVTLRPSVLLKDAYLIEEGTSYGEAFKFSAPFRIGVLRHVTEDFALVAISNMEYSSAMTPAQIVQLVQTVNFLVAYNE